MKAVTGKDFCTRSHALRGNVWFVARDRSYAFPRGAWERECSVWERENLTLHAFLYQYTVLKTLNEDCNVI